MLRQKRETPDYVAKSKGGAVLGRLAENSLLPKERKRARLRCKIGKRSCLGTHHGETTATEKREKTKLRSKNRKKQVQLLLPVCPGQEFSDTQAVLPNRRPVSVFRYLFKLFPHVLNIVLFALFPASHQITVFVILETEMPADILKQ